MPVGTLSFEDVNTPEGFCEKFFGIKFNNDVPKYPTKLVDNTNGMLSEYCDQAELQELTRGVSFDAYTLIIKATGFPVLLLSL